MCELNSSNFSLIKLNFISRISGSKTSFVILSSPLCHHHHQIAFKYFQSFLLISTTPLWLCCIVTHAVCFPIWDLFIPVCIFLWSVFFTPSYRLFSKSSFSVLHWIFFSCCSLYHWFHVYRSSRLLITVTGHQHVTVTATWTAINNFRMRQSF